jgi:hypothetical protein
MLPSIHEMKKISQRMALLDALFEPEWEYRYYSFNKNWSPDQQMGSMRDGTGNHFFILFESDSIFVKVIEKESDNIAEIKRAVATFSDPATKEGLTELLNEPAFYTETASCLFWNTDGSWKKLPAGGDLPEELKIFNNPVKEYDSHLETYFELSIDESELRKVFTSQITYDLLLSIRPDVDFDQIREDIEEIGLEISGTIP